MTSPSRISTLLALAILCGCRQPRQEACNPADSAAICTQVQKCFASDVSTEACREREKDGLGGIVYDPTQAAHAIEQIAQGENILQNSIQLAQTSLAYYQLAYQMSIAPQSVYAGWTSPSTYWQLLEMTANTYGNSQPFMASANSGAGADAAYQMASVPRYGPVPEYPTLSLQGQQQIAATGA